MARALTAWTSDIVWCSDGKPTSDGQLARLRDNGIRIREERIAALEGKNGRLRAILFKDGSRLARRALFFDTPVAAQSRLAESLGCQFGRRGGVRCWRYEATSVPGVYVAGNIIKDVQLAIVAAAEGARAAFGINKALTCEEFERRATGRRVVDHPVPGRDHDLTGERQMIGERPTSPALGLQPADARGCARRCDRDAATVRAPETCAPDDRSQPRGFPRTRPRRAGGDGRCRASR